MEKSAESYRLFKEAELLANNRKLTFFEQSINNKVTELLKKLGCEAIKVNSKFDKTYFDEVFKGTVNIDVEVLYRNNFKKINLTAFVENDEIKLPDEIVIVNILDKAPIKELIEESIEEKISVIEPEIQKTASIPPSTVLSPVIKVDKTWLPLNIKVNDILFIDGAKYRVMSGDAGKLSSESDGSFWTLYLITETAKPEEEIKYII